MINHNSREQSIILNKEILKLFIIMVEQVEWFRQFDIVVMVNIMLVEELVEKLLIIRFIIVMGLFLFIEHRIIKSLVIK